MKVKRLFTSISANFDDLITKIENHEAVANSVIDDVSHGAAKVKGQLRFQQKRQNDFDQEEEKLQNSIKLWKERALKTRETDQEKALQCLKSLKVSETQLTSLKAQRKDCDQLVSELSARLNEIESRLNELQNKKSLLSARSARNKAVEISTQSCANMEAETVFSRWEERVLAEEYSAQYVSSQDIDPLDHEFRETEDRESLLAELHLLEDSDDSQKSGAN